MPPLRKTPSHRGGTTPAVPKRVPPTEVEAYGHIRKQLLDLEWRVSNPSLKKGGQVWTQNQCRSDPNIRRALGLTCPENIVKVTETDLWVIEAKADRRDLDKAIDEAQRCYAEPINAEGAPLRAHLATGIAGDEDNGYISTTRILLGGRWQPVTINGQPATGLLSPKDAHFLTENQLSDVHEFLPEQGLFLSSAERINEILHAGGINKNDRARVMAALLLAVIDDPPNLNTSLQVLIGDINARSRAVLQHHNKDLFEPFVQIVPPTNTSNHAKYKAAIVQTMQELLDLNIRSAMNSSTDVLGQFYEVFLKYGNGAKEIGIVLTPRHITRFAVEAVGIDSDDLVLDPACGTGGFLVAAYDHVRRTAKPAQLDRFKVNNIFGIEQDPQVALLAMVNMIFRGDGSNNLTEANCFTTALRGSHVSGSPTAQFAAGDPIAGREPITRVLMNPPFALQGGVEQEYKFVRRALSLMKDGGLLFSLVPMDCMFGARDEKTWRQDELLRFNTLMAVITLPYDLFVPAAQKQVAAIIVRKGHPHPAGQPVFWARVASDGHVVVKKKRLAGPDHRPPRSVDNDFPRILPQLQAFLAAPGATLVNQPMLCKTAPIDFTDPLLELLPELYLDAIEPTGAALELAIEDMARDIAALLVRSRKEELAGDYDAHG